MVNYWINLFYELFTMLLRYGMFLLSSTICFMCIDESRPMLSKGLEVWEKNVEGRDPNIKEGFPRYWRYTLVNYIEA